jgi:hypothetical protein
MLDGIKDKDDEDDLIGKLFEVVRIWEVWEFVERGDLVESGDSVIERVGRLGLLTTQIKIATVEIELGEWFDQSEFLTERKFWRGERNEIDIQASRHCWVNHRLLMKVFEKSLPKVVTDD